MAVYKNRSIHECSNCEDIFVEYDSNNAIISQRRYLKEETEDGKETLDILIIDKDEVQQLVEYLGEFMRSKE